MNYLKISNKGLLDIRLVALMGGTTKSGDNYKIGQFGTGLKYTLAYLFRNNIDFKIFVGKTEIKITIAEENIGGEIFRIICIDGNRTSITTKMGQEWEPWMIVRELYSNALDEGEAAYSATQEIEGQENKTTFFIELTPEFLQVYNDWNKYFIVDRLPMYQNASFALHPTSGNLKIYKQGILIYEETRPALFNYDLKSAHINELREYKGCLEADISRLLFQINDPKVISYFIENLITKDQNKDKYFESRIDLTFWQSNTQMDNAWKQVIGNAKVIHPDAKRNILAREANIDLSGTITVPENLYKALTQSFEGIGALRTADKLNEFYEIYDEELNLTLKRAIVILEEAGYFIHPELKFIFGEFGSKQTLAQIKADDKEILISHRMKDKSLFEFCAMLIEENEHFQTGHSDCTRDFQQHFIDLYAKAIFDKAEIKL